jgi:hypothetical protein
VRLKREGKQDGTPEIPGSDPYGLEGKPVKNKTPRAWRHRSIKDRKIVKLGLRASGRVRSRVTRSHFLSLVGSE